MHHDVCKDMLICSFTQDPLTVPRCTPSPWTCTPDIYTQLQAHTSHLKDTHPHLTTLTDRTPSIVYKYHLCKLITLFSNLHSHSQSQTLFSSPLIYILHSFTPSMDWNLSTLFTLNFLSLICIPHTETHIDTANILIFLVTHTSRWSHSVFGVEKRDKELLGNKSILLYLLHLICLSLPLLYAPPPHLLP